MKVLKNVGAGRVAKWATKVKGNPACKMMPAIQAVTECQIKKVPKSVMASRAAKKGENRYKTKNT
jgi:hypothetical protein